MFGWLYHRGVMDVHESWFLNFCQNTMTVGRIRTLHVARRTANIHHQCVRMKIKKVIFLFPHHRFFYCGDQKVIKNKNFKDALKTRP